jgi:hypothetical protein
VPVGGEGGGGGEREEPWSSPYAFYLPRRSCAVTQSEQQRRQQRDLQPLSHNWLCRPLPKAPSADLATAFGPQGLWLWLWLAAEWGQKTT